MFHALPATLTFAQSRASEHKGARYVTRLETETPWLSYDQVEEYTGVERTTIWRAMRTGKLRAGRCAFIGRIWTGS